MELDRYFAWVLWQPRFFFGDSLSFFFKRNINFFHFNVIKIDYVIADFVKRCRDTWNSINFVSFIELSVCNRFIRITTITLFILRCQGFIFVLRKFIIWFSIKSLMQFPIISFLFGNVFIKIIYLSELLWQNSVASGKEFFLTFLFRFLSWLKLTKHWKTIIDIINPVKREITQHITLLDKLDSKFIQNNDVIKKWWHQQF